MAGCWVMREEKEVKEVEEEQEKNSANLEADSETCDDNRQDKIIVRSNGTVTYVGKDIAYQLWKFGLLGKDFHYQRWMNAPEGETVWPTTTHDDDPPAPLFGEPAARCCNVIDTRQPYLMGGVAHVMRGLRTAIAAAHA